MEASKLVALESFTQVRSFFENITSCLCGSPLNLFIAPTIVVSVILKILAILYAKAKFSILPSLLKYILLIFFNKKLHSFLWILISFDFNFLILNILRIDFEYLFVKLIYE